MTQEELERVEELVDEFGQQLAKEVKSETDFLSWLKAARNELTTQIQLLGGDGASEPFLGQLQPDAK